jgi:hypothetical protein
VRVSEQAEYRLKPSPSNRSYLSVGSHFVIVCRRPEFSGIAWQPGAGTLNKALGIHKENLMQPIEIIDSWPA